MTPAEAVPAGSAPLLPALDILGGPPRPHPAPESMEKLGQAHGLIHYRTTITGPRPAMPVRIDGLGDRAYVFADGRPLGVLDRNAPDEGLELAVGEHGVVLDLLVRAQGRVNYGPLLDDRKGIWRGVRHGHQHLFEWEIRPLPLCDSTALSALDWTTGHPSEYAPAFHRFTHTEPAAPADGFIDLSAWGTGLIWLNGFLLGHYDTPRGPQRTLYAPAPSGAPGPTRSCCSNWNAPARPCPCATGPTSAAPRSSPWSCEADTAPGGGTCA